MSKPKSLTKHLSFMISLRDYNRVVECVEAGDDVNGYIIDQHGRKIHNLYCAVRSNNMDIIKYLVLKGAVIDQVNGRFEMTALHFAAHMGYFEIVKFLLDNGASKDCETADFNNAVSYAKMGGHDVIEAYIKAYDDGLTKGVNAG